jgi:hypothetical protein
MAGEVKERRQSTLEARAAGARRLGDQHHMRDHG